MSNWKIEEDNACLWDTKKITLEIAIECGTHQQTNFDYKTLDLVHRMYLKKRSPKINMIKKSNKSKVGKGITLIEEEVEIYQKQNDDDVVQGMEQEEHGQNEEEAQNPEEENEVQSQDEAEEVQA